MPLICNALLVWPKFVGIISLHVPGLYYSTILACSRSNFYNYTQPEKNMRSGYRLNQILHIHAAFVCHGVPKYGPQAKNTLLRTTTTSNFSGHSSPQMQGRPAGSQRYQQRPQLMRDAARGSAAGYGGSSSSSRSERTPSIELHISCSAARAVDAHHLTPCAS